MPNLTTASGTNAIALPAWLVAIVGAWMIAPELGLAASLGYISQWALKAPAVVRDWLGIVIVGGVCLAFWIFVLGHRPETFWPLPPKQWWVDWALWTAGVLGIGSTAGHTGGAPRTNSL